MEIDSSELLSIPGVLIVSASATREAAEEEKDRSLGVLNTPIMASGDEDDAGVRRRETMENAGVRNR